MKSNMFRSGYLTASLLFICVSFSSLSLMSCSESDTNKTIEHYCPMKCEGDKTYPTEGSCPVCGMDLKEIN